MNKEASLNKENIIIWLLVLLISIYLVNIFFNVKDSEKIDYLKSEVKSIDIDVKQIYKSNKIQEKKLDNFKSELKQIDNEIIINNKKIQNLNNYEKKQTNSFATYGNSEWEKYFADRYKE